MKKKIFTLLALFACVLSASAQENALAVGETTVAKGGEGVVNVELNNATNFCAYSFKLILPTGVSVVTEDVEEEMTDEEGNTIYESDGITPKTQIVTKVKMDLGTRHPGHSVTGEVQSDGSVQFACLSLSNQNLSGHSGVLLGISIKGADDLTIGDKLDASITNVVFSTKSETEYNLDPVAFKIEVADNRVVLDETSTVAPTAATGVNVKVKRTINANVWSTICLPFAMSEAQVKAAFGDDVKLGDFTGYTPTYDGDNVTAISVNFSDVTAIEANHPYIIKVSSAITEFNADGVTINPQEAIVSFGTTTGSGKNKVYHPSDFIGTYVADFDFYVAATSAALFLSENKFWYATDATKHMKAFRAFFDFDDYMPEADTSSAPIFISFDNNTTGVNNIQRTMGDDRYYNMKGQQVDNPTQKGVYIQNGKKVVVK